MNIFQRHRSRSNAHAMPRRDDQRREAREARDMVLSDPMTASVLHTLR